VSGLRLYSAAFACMLVAGVLLLIEGRSLSITTSMSAASALVSVAAIGLGLAALRRR
jgi:hypothetical protein